MENNNVSKVIKQDAIENIRPEEVTAENVLTLKKRIKKAEEIFLLQKNMLYEKDEYITHLKDEYLESQNQLLISDSDNFKLIGSPVRVQQEVEQTEKVLKIKHPNLNFTQEDLCTIHSIVRENKLNLTSKDIWIYQNSKGANIIVTSIYAYRKIASSYLNHHYGIKYYFGIKNDDGKMGWADLVENVEDIQYCKAIMTHIDPLGRSLDTETTMKVKDYKKMYNGKPTGTWANYQLTMIQKVAEGQVIRAKFPSLGGTLTEDEIGDIEGIDKKKISNVVIDTS